MIWIKIDEIFRELPNIFGTTNDILIIGCDYNAQNHDRTVCSVLQKYSKENLIKTNAISYAHHSNF